MNIKEIIDSFPRKHPNGFNPSEIEEILKNFPKIDLEKFNDEISADTYMKDDINNAGAIYTDLPAVIDDRIITTAHYKDMGPWMKAVLEQFYKKQII